MQSTDDTKDTSALKPRDALAEVILVDPITLPIAKALAKLEVHPLVITMLAFAFRIACACLFVLNHLALAAICSIIGFYLDGIDGKVARIRHVDEDLHGAVDFLLDQVAFATMGIGALIWTIYHGYNVPAVLIGSWLAFYMVFMAFTSTWFRILSQSGISYGPGTQKSVFYDSISSSKHGAIIVSLEFIGRVHSGAMAKLERFRTVPYFGPIESEVFIFMIAPFFGFETVIVGLSIVFLVPDILTYFGLCLLHLTRARRLS